MRRGDQPAFQSTQGELDASAELPLADLATEFREPGSTNTSDQTTLPSGAVTSAATCVDSCRAAIDTPRLAGTAGTAVATSTFPSSTMGSTDEQERLDTLLDDAAPSTAEYQARRAALDTIESAATAALESVSNDPSGRPVDSNDHTRGQPPSRLRALAPCPHLRRRLSSAPSHAAPRPAHHALLPWTNMVSSQQHLFA